MVTSRRLSEEEVQQISWRMKSARMLTGLTQENFSVENDISLTSLKCWEMGRAVPRREGALSYVNAIKKKGIDVSLDWIFHGSGPGPTYVNGTQVEKPKTDSSYIEQQIELFKRNQLSKGLNPIVTEISDQDMVPQFKPGDMIGAFYVTMNEIASLQLNSIIETPWLLMLDGKNFVPRFLVPGERGQVFYYSQKDPVIRSGSVGAIGRICWHYKDTCQ
jgi:DNA-binding transcriptional regulator YiaG